MKKRVNIRLISITLYIIFYNFYFVHSIDNLFQSDLFILTILNDLLFLYLPMVFLSSFKQATKLNLKLKKQPVKMEVLLGILFVVCFALASTLLQLCYQLTKFTLNDFLTTRDSIDVFLPSLIGAVILAPIFEEQSRRYLFSEVETAYKNKALLIMSLHFTSTHLVQILHDPTTLPIYLIISLYLNLQYFRYRNLVYNVILHALYNLSVSIASYYFYFIPTKNYAYVITITLVILFSLLLTSFRHRHTT